MPVCRAPIGPGENWLGTIRMTCGSRARSASGFASTLRPGSVTTTISIRFAQGDLRTAATASHRESACFPAVTMTLASNMPIALSILPAQTPHSFMILHACRTRIGMNCVAGAQTEKSSRIMPAPSGSPAVSGGRGKPEGAGALGATLVRRCQLSASADVANLVCRINYDWLRVRDIHGQ